ncbi:MAG: hypothetical protein QXV17_07025, partial [Candidatus Micrarchaeaceae archaeon]
ATQFYLPHGLFHQSFGEASQNREMQKMIELKDVYESLEEVTDKCIDVLDVMSDIMLRYAYQGA